MRQQETHVCWRCLSAEAVVTLVPCGRYAVCDACADLLVDYCVWRAFILSSVVLLAQSSSHEGQQQPSEQKRDQNREHPMAATDASHIEMC
ncbi:hypothetical protein, conserved [Leishmania tarentolae]|uniref:Uncharacterized protein n=1 Tax=Leishmania tarentolae TaxID=5689 RepID=A0A640KMB2_LEITA|nr:hypothetical protein, conserved [Leishmania tarentolae]